MSYTKDYIDQHPGILNQDSDDLDYQYEEYLRNYFQQIQESEKDFCPHCQEYVGESQIGVEYECPHCGEKFQFSNDANSGTEMGDSKTA